MPPPFPPAAKRLGVEPRGAQRRDGFTLVRAKTHHPSFHSIS
jgi:hypothetical protein